ncbi:MAG: hypothetical protein L0H83_10765 [Salinisphaera sp.]|nr:hypothetical protein [Salinisphaera sp.]
MKVLVLGHQDKAVRGGASPDYLIVRPRKAEVDYMRRVRKKACDVSGKSLSKVFVE